MNRSRLRFKALGACALPFSLMAVWAGAAQASGTGGSSTYIDPATGQLKTFEGALAEPELGAEVDVTLVLHAEALEGTKVLYECTALSATAGSKLKANGVALGKLVFSGCSVKLNGVASAPCRPKGGSVTTNLIKTQMLLHELEDGTIHKILIAEGETATEGAANFATIESEGACALGTKIPIGGRVATLPSNPTTHEVKHLIKEFAPLMYLWILSNTPEHRATSLLGSVWTFLTGAHFGLKFAGLWN